MEGVIERIYSHCNLSQKTEKKNAILLFKNAEAQIYIWDNILLNVTKGQMNSFLFKSHRTLEKKCNVTI